MPDQLIGCIRSYYRFKLEDALWQEKLIPASGEVASRAASQEYFFQCKHCLSLADHLPQAPLPGGYQCSVCDAPAEEFEQKEKSELFFQDSGFKI